MIFGQKLYGGGGITHIKYSNDFRAKTLTRIFDSLFFDVLRVEYLLKICKFYTEFFNL